MPEPVSVSLFTLALGQAAGPLIQKAAENHVTAFFGDRLKELAKLGTQKPTLEAVKRAWTSCIELALDRIRVLGDYDLIDLADDEEWKAYGQAFRRYLQDKVITEELLGPLLDPEDDAPDPFVLSDAWRRCGGPELPAGFNWTAVAEAYRKRLEKGRLLSPELRTQLDAENIAAIRRLLEGRLGVQPRGDEARYARRMREKYRVLDLSAMRPPTSDETGQILVRDAFVPQNVRENPPPVELPRDVLRKLVEEGVQGEDEMHRHELLGHQLEHYRDTFSQRPSEGVLRVVTAPGNPRLVLIGGPGSGKSTLTRYLLLSVFEPPRDLASGDRSPWSRFFDGYLPLLVELREFIAGFDAQRYDNFLGFFHYLGKTEKYHLDEAMLDRRLRTGPTLVLFDGLDEIFDARQRKHVMQAIVGFAGTYPQARVIVTSRPVGYSDQVLKAADFRHYQIEDLDDPQIETFVTEWFGRLFADRPTEAKKRQDRILKATKAPAIRLLAGNPMLLTIMALIAQLRELPRERWRFYDYAAEVLCHHWEVNRDLEEEGFKDFFLVEDKKDLLRRIAMVMQEGEGGLAGNMIRESVLRDEIDAYLKERFGMDGAEAQTRTLRMIRQLRERNYILCLRGSQLYGFVHRTLLEYFCAAEWSRRLGSDPDFSVDDLKQVVAEHWRDPAWREVLRLICGMADEKTVGGLIDYLSQEAYPDWRARIEEEPPVNLVLAIQCLGEVRNPQVVEQEGQLLLETFVNTLISLDELEGQEYGELIRGELLVDFIEYRIPELARAWFIAEWQRASSQVESLFLKWTFAELAGRWLIHLPWETLQNYAISDGSEYVRIAALEALGRGWSQESSTRDLLRERALQDEHASVRSAALEALGRGWSQESSTRDLLRERALQDENSNVRIAALSALRVDRRVRILMSRDLDGFAPLFAAFDPLPEDHIRTGAERLSLDETAARELLASSEKVLGWNPLEGGRVALERRKKG